MKHYPNSVSKALALLMALVMTLSLAVTSAFAVSYQDMNPKDDALLGTKFPVDATITLVTDENGKAVDGVTVAASIGEDPACVYKTLVTQGNSKNYFVFVIPVAAELDLKAAARSVGEKSVAMIHVADINKVTGYVRGGCSPVGMKKQYRTVFDESVLTQQKVYVSGGRIGTQVCCAPADLIRAARAATAKIIF